MARHGAESAPLEVTEGPQTPNEDVVVLDLTRVVSIPEGSKRTNGASEAACRQVDAKLIAMEDERKRRDYRQLSEAGADEVEELVLSENELSSLPGTVVRLFGTSSTLAALILDNNCFEQIPAELGVRSIFRELWVLSLRENRIQSLPADLAERLPELRFLDLSGNFLRHIPQELEKLKSLEKLVLDRNQLRHVPGLPASSLVELSVVANPLEQLPSAVCSCGRLERLALAHCNLLDMPDSASFPKMVVLNLSWNKLSELPGCLRNCSELKRLDLSHNALQSLPDWFASSFPNLAELYLDSNQLVRLPDDFGTLTNLKKLSLVRNPELCALPVSFRHLRLDEFDYEYGNLKQEGHLPHTYVQKALDPVFGQEIADENARSHHRDSQEELRKSKREIVITRARKTNTRRMRPFGCQQM
ncbi:Erbin [Porphyridium purpureum]|uniref:Erbin n=1 Tax=Porphyridium purpureum TaxID=35688 RepID=A0A5J4YJD2_PORPP|nr:Erbin [Porphyridium purpureum]|eukprot:POR3434..scf261_15